MRRMSWCSRNCATKLLLSFWRWKKALVVLVLIGIPIIMQVQDYMETAYLKFLLENEFAESHTQLPSRRLPEVPKGLVGSKIGGHDRRTKYLAGSRCFGGIQSMPKYSHWFRERFKANIKLFLEKHDADNIRNLSHYVLPFGFKNENHELIHSLLRHENFKNPPLDLRLRNGTCITCAVVGSGGILNGSRLGAEIDSHDFVFRLNTALTHGKYAQDVGSKTHFYAFFPESAHIQNVWDQNVTLIYIIYKASDVDYAAKMLKISRPRTSEDVDFRRVKIVHPDFFRYSFARFLDGKSWRPTTGAVTVLLAVHLCDTVAVYGFGYDSRFTLHYYDKAFTRRPILPMLVHDVYNERKLWTKLHSERVIRYIQRDVT